MRTLGVSPWSEMAKIKKIWKGRLSTRRNTKMKNHWFQSYSRHSLDDMEGALLCDASSTGVSSMQISCPLDMLDSDNNSSLNSDTGKALDFLDKH